MKLLLSRSSAIVFFGAALVAGQSQIAFGGDQNAAVQRRQGFCAAYGPGFVAVEGAQTCVRIGGHIRVELETTRPLRFEEATPFATPQQGLTAVSSPQFNSLDR